MDQIVNPRPAFDGARRKFLQQAAALVAVIPAPNAVFERGQEARAAAHGRSAPPPDMIPIPEYMVYAPLPDGRLIGVVGETQGGHAVARYSADSGKTFTESTRLFPLDVTQGNWSMHNAFLDREGELQLIYTNDANTVKERRSFYDVHYDIWHVRSSDSRRRWSSPTPVWQGYAGSLLSFTQLRNGRVLLPFTYRTPRTWGNRGEGFDAFAFMGRFSSTAAYSDDNGATWHVSPSQLKEPSPQIGDDGGIEPIVLELNDGRIWMLIRTQWGRFYESYSSDGGALWTPPVPSGILSGNSPCSFTRLPDNRIVIMWNNNLRYCYANGGRAVLHAAISEDDGRSWRGYREVAANPLAKQPPPPNGDHGVTYTVPALAADGHIVTSLSLGPGGGTYLLRLDPEWLYRTTREDEFSGGLSAWQTFGTRGVALAAHPSSPNRQVLAIRKPDVNWPAGAVWNFPAGRRGKLRIHLMLRPGFGGALLGLTDHFSVPFDAEDKFHNVFNLELLSGGALKDGGHLALDHWHDLTFSWDIDQRRCRVATDGREITSLTMRRETVGPSYLRLRSTVLGQDQSGMLVESVSADVGESWK